MPAPVFSILASMRCRALIVLYLIAGYCRAQSPNYLYFDDTNGLLDFEQYSLLQDKDKYIWIAGNSGVFKYNGINFKMFHPDAQVNRSLTNLRCDRYNRIWCHDFSGNIYYIHNGQLKLFELWNKKNSTTFPVFEISDDRLWVIYDEGINCYAIPANSSGFKLLNSTKLSNARSARLFQGNLFVSGLNSVLSIDARFKTKTYPIHGNHLSDFLKAWSSYFELNAHLYLLSRQEKTIYKLDGNEFIVFKKLDFLPDIITCKTIGDDLWVLTRSGAYCFNKALEVRNVLFKHVPISDVITDHEHNYWFSTLTKGVLLVPNLNSITYTAPNQQGFTKLTRYQNKLIAGGTDGNLYALNNDSLVAITHAKNNKEISFLSMVNHSLYFGNINFYKLSANGHVQNLGINPPFKQVDAISENTLLVADPGGLYYYSLDNPKHSDNAIPQWIRAYVHDVPISVNNKVIRVNKSILPERTNTFCSGNNFILAASKNGTYLITGKVNQLQYFNNKPIYSTDFASTDTCVYTATAGFGILLFNHSKWETLKDLNIQLHSLYIQKIKLIGNDLWIANDEGIIKYNLQNKRLTHYGREDGLITCKINDLCDFEGNLFVASSKGLMAFPLSDVGRARVNPPVILNAVMCDGGLLSFTGNLIKTNPNSHIVSFKFDVLAYNAPEAYLLRYKREGSDFVYLNKQDYHVVLNQLTPGENKVLIELFDKQLNKPIYSKQFVVFVNYAFYQTLYFKISVILLLALTIGLLIKKRLQIIHRKNLELIEKEKLLTELKQSMLTSIKAQMNPHFIFNALNTIQSYVLKNDRMQASFYLGKFSDLIRKILQMSNKDSVTIREETEALQLYLELENMRLNNELNFTINDEAIFDLLSKKIPSMIIQPYVENAIKHGLLHKKENKKLDIVFYKTDSHHLKITITDNGIGRQAAEQIKQRNPAYHQSFSSEANRKRLELLNAQNKHLIAVTYDDLRDSNLQPTGTRVTIHIPLT